MHQCNGWICVAHFYRAMHFSAKRGIALACRLSVRPSVCLSVCNVGELWSHRLEFFENNFAVSWPGTFALCNPNMTGLLQGEHPEIFARIGVGCWESSFRRTKALVSLKRGKIGPRLLLRSNKKSYTHFRLVPKSMTLDDLEGSLCILFQNTCFFRSSLWKFEWR